MDHGAFRITCPAKPHHVHTYMYTHFIPPKTYTNDIYIQIYTCTGHMPYLHPKHPHILPYTTSLLTLFIPTTHIHIHVHHTCKHTHYEKDD